MEYSRKNQENIAIEGEILNIIFQNEDNDFGVINLKHNDSTIIAAGDIADIEEGQQVRLHGSWTTHHQYGKQFKVTWSEKVTPNTLNGLKKYLASNAFKGIGPDMANRIVEHFKEHTLKALEGGASTIQAVNGIGPKRANSIAEIFKEGRDTHHVMAELRGLGLNARQSKNIFELFGAASIATIKKDPYGLAIWIRGVGFKTADQIALSIGIPHDSPIRAAGICVHLLQESQLEGHSCLPEEYINDRLNSHGLSYESILDGIKSAIETGRVIKAISSHLEGSNNFYLPELFFAENAIASHIQRLLNLPKQPIATEQDMASAIQHTDYPPDDSQKNALRMALKEKVSVITGGPGTGKTTTMRLLIEIIHRAGIEKIKLASPTGRAAKRLSEATGNSASTIHRLLKFDPIKGDFTHNEDNPLDVDYLIIDEFSMCDLKLCASLMCAIPDEASLLIIGDADQLPSVGAGAILRDLVQSRLIPTTELTLIHRQDGGSGIVDAAHAVLRGETPKTVESANGSFFLSEIESAEQGAILLEKIISERIPKRYNLSPRQDLLTIAPMYKGALGVNEINDTLSKVLNSQGPQISWANELRVGDKVMVTKNDYEREIYNGDCGHIIDANEKEMIIEIEDYHHYYSKDDLKDIIPAYCITVHRAQGSESNAVVIVLTNGHYPMLRRNLLYTAITRGKDVVVLITQKQALQRAITNNDESKRFGDLQHRIANPQPIQRHL